MRDLWWMPNFWLEGLSFFLHRGPQQILKVVFQTF